MANDGTKLVVTAKNLFRRTSEKSGKEWLTVGLVVCAPSDRRGQWVNYRNWLDPEKPDHTDRVREDFRRMGIEGDPATITPETFMAPEVQCVVIEKFDDFWQKVAITNVLGPPSESYLKYLESKGEDLSLPKRRQEDNPF